MQNVLYTLSMTNYEINMVDKEKQRIADLGRYFRPRLLKKKELMKNVMEIIDKIDANKDRRDKADYTFWKHQQMCL